MEKRGEKHFVLVHGACHGAWCWYKVATLLKTAGHRVTALDMAASGTHPSQFHEVPSISDYFKPMTEFMASLPPEERVILVGHSMGGYCISAAMESFPEKVSVAVFCTAFMPGPEFIYTTLSVEINRRLDSYMDTVFTFGNGPNNQPTSLLFGPDFMLSKLYQLSPVEDLTLAGLSARPLPLYDDEAMNEAMALTKDKYGSVHRVFIVCDRDNILQEDFQRWMIENNPTDDVKLISGSDHMPMFSKPKELCLCLQEIAEKYP
ncbi:hypothetical protein Dsin_010052 [Dipteronia sinensis]|uniref:AB hydrolase-1 domain-containing protein n=1 Tax=Dipteronia sinensis TaxID=43782 RepID=A0AAE0ECP4_9ROSI|nr:hypothetical protein Dsin_010052 [Dipteronia sinensis]